jgi:protoporphyrinogen/coproporphyrinogen III oxidase
VAGPRVIVAGAGLSGLACAFDLARGGADVRLLEASSDAGGVVGTIERDGFLFEKGPFSVQAGSEPFRRLCGDLGIAGRIIACSDASEDRYLFLRGKLRRLPSSPADLLRTDVLSLRGRMSAASEPVRRWTPPPAGAPEPDLESFLVERIGAEATRVLAGAFVRGVYAAELSELGARSAFPKLWQACVEHGGIVRGLAAAGRASAADLPGPDVKRSALISFPEGLRGIVRALEDALGGRIRKDHPVEALELGPSGWSVRSPSNASETADHLVLAVPAPAAARLLEPVAAGRSSGFPIGTLKNIRHAAVTVVHLGLETKEVPRWPRGFGYLVPPVEAAGAPRALGTIFVSNLFPGRAPEGSVALSSFYRESEVQGLDDRGAAALACEDLTRALGGPRAPEPRVVEVRRYTDVIPRYGPGHADAIAGLLRQSSRSLPGLHLAGSYVAGVSVGEVIARGRAVAREILAGSAEGTGG